MTLFRIYYHSFEDKLPISELDIHPDVVSILHELGMVDISAGTIDSANLRRLYRILRIKNVMGVNLTGASIIVDLLDRIEELEDEMEDLKRKR